VNQDLLSLGEEFWAWRSTTQPLSGDDIPRIERPSGWVPDWSPDSIVRRREQLAVFQARWRSLESGIAQARVQQQVDHRLIGSALARVRWELDILRGWQRDPHFYVHQTLGALFEALLPPPPFDPTRADDLLRRAESIPPTLDAARANLAGHAIQPFARRAIAALDDVGARLRTVARELSPLVETQVAQQLATTFESAARALERFQEWLRAGVDDMPLETAIGRDAYTWFLTHVALVPLSPERITFAARQELERAVAFETLERRRNRDLPELPLPTSQAEQIAREASGEQMLRDFCENHDLLTFPGWLRRYRNLPLPAYLTPLRDLGVNDDLTSATRLDEDAVSYIREPASDLPYFYLAMARDPRTLIAHEGMHYYQLARAWSHPDPLRRFYYDSGPNEGIGFYAEEMLLQSGLFDDSPRSREVLYSFMRLRAVRVGVDIRLAFGELTVDEAADELAQLVPMDLATAREEASAFASEPGQAITYQVGKLQILGFLADARRLQGDAFTLRGFHDSLWENGNVPIALLRLEVLGEGDQVRLLDTASNRLTT
jgi:Bacterial protein of unknown function (DUF885)